MSPEEVREWRERLGYSQAQLAAALSEPGHRIHRRTVAAWEAGRQRPQPYLRAALWALDRGWQGVQGVERTTKAEERSE